MNRSYSRSLAPLVSLLLPLAPLGCGSASADDVVAQGSDSLSAPDASAPTHVGSSARAAVTTMATILGKPTKTLILTQTDLNQLADLALAGSKVQFDQTGNAADEEEITSPTCVAAKPSEIAACRVNCPTGDPTLLKQCFAKCAALEDCGVCTPHPTYDFARLGGFLSGSTTCSAASQTCPACTVGSSTRAIGDQDFTTLIPNPIFDTAIGSGIANFSCSLGRFDLDSQSASPTYSPYGIQVSPATIDLSVQPYTSKPAVACTLGIDANILNPQFDLSIHPTIQGNQPHAQITPTFSGHVDYVADWVYSLDSTLKSKIEGVMTSTIAKYQSQIDAGFAAFLAQQIKAKNNGDLVNQFIDLEVTGTGASGEMVVTYTTPDCQGASDAYGIVAGQTFGFAPPEVQTWWKAKMCNTSPRSSSNLCQKASEIYGIVAGVTFGYAPPSVQGWWQAAGCDTNPLETENACQRASDTYGIAAGVTFGDAPASVRSWWVSAGCSSAPRPLTACQMASELYGIAGGVTFGYAPSDARSWWTANGCNTDPISDPGTCQRASDTYGIVAYQTWGFAPADVQSWWSANGCLTVPRSADSCQRASERYGIVAGQTFGFAPSNVQSWWSANGCNTAPLFSEDACQRASDTYGIVAGQTFGFAPSNVQSWWSANGCNTQPLTTEKDYQ